MAATVRIGVLGLFRPGELSVRPAPQTALLIEAGDRRVILVDGKSAHLRVAGRVVQCTIAEYTLTASAIHAKSRVGGPAEFILSVPGRIARAYRGVLEVSARDRELLPVVAMDLETAVASAVEAESPPGASLEALKAQAIVTRSYYVAARPRHAGFDFCDTTHCQFLREPPAPATPAMAATELTRGLVLTYRGEVLPALFSASCGGRTRSLAEIGVSSQGYPYYSMKCEYCLRRASHWATVLNLEEADCLLEGEVTEAKRLRIGRKVGWNTIPGNNYEPNRYRGSVTIRGRGQGHGIGLCQLGASGMAAKGATFRDILEYYFPNTSLGEADH